MATAQHPHPELPPGKYLATDKAGNTRVFEYAPSLAGMLRWFHADLPYMTRATDDPRDEGSTLDALPHKPAHRPRRDPGKVVIDFPIR